MSNIDIAFMNEVRRDAAKKLFGLMGKKHPELPLDQVIRFCDSLSRVAVMASVAVVECNDHLSKDGKTLSEAGVRMIAEEAVKFDAQREASIFRKE